MASSLRTKLRIVASVLLAPGFWDAVAGRWLWQPSSGNNGRQPPPDGPPNTNAPRSWQDLRGAVHVHSTYSDGAGDVPTIMTAACEAGVDWVLLTDHNTQRPLREGWETKYASKPLLLIGTEVTVEHGAFLLALQMPPPWEPTKYLPPQAAVDVVNQHNGLPLISLPFDVKHPWLDWNVAGYQGLEVINFSTIARRHVNLPSLLWLFGRYRKNGMLDALRTLVTRPDQELALWDQLTQDGRQMVGLGALDAHALMKIGKKKYPLPSYADSFRALATHVLVATPDRDAIYQALRVGRCYLAYDCVADPTGFWFGAQHPDGQAVMGERIALGKDLRLVAEAPVVATPPTGVLLRLLRNGKLVAASDNKPLDYLVTDPGVYRVEAYRYAVRVGPLRAGVRPWVFSNPVYVTPTPR